MKKMATSDKAADSLVTPKHTSPPHILYYLRLGRRAHRLDERREPVRVGDAQRGGHVGLGGGGGCRLFSLCSAVGYSKGACVCAALPRDEGLKKRVSME